MLFKINYSIIGLLTALIFWFADSSIHYFLYHEDSFEWVPGDFNELWMRALIFLLFIAFGTYAQEKKKMMIRLLKEKEIAQETFQESVMQLAKKMNNLTDELTAQTDSKEKIINELIASLEGIRDKAERTDGMPEEFLKSVCEIVDEAAKKIGRICQSNNMDKN